MAAPPIDDLDPFDLFDAEAERLNRFFSDLRRGAWERPTRCEGWRVRDVLAHLGGEEMYNHACLDGFNAALRAAGLRGLDGFQRVCVRQRSAKPVEDRGLREALRCLA